MQRLTEAHPATVVVGQAGQGQGEVAHVVAQRLQLGEALGADHRGHRHAVALHHHLVAVGGVGHEPGDAPPAASVTLTCSVQWPSVNCTENCTRPRDILDLPAGVS